MKRRWEKWAKVARANEAKIPITPAQLAIPQERVAAILQSKKRFYSRFFSLSWHL
jgi:hypothetical protein